MEPTKILHVITGLGVGGAEMMLSRLVRWSCSERYRHEVLSLMDLGPLAAPIAALGVPVQSLGMQPSKPTLGAAYRLRQAMARTQADIIQGWMYHGNLAANLGTFLARSKAKVIWNIRHSLHELALEKPLTRRIIRVSVPLSKRPRAIIYNARASARHHESLGYAAERTTIIPNGFDCETFRPDAAIRAEMRADLGLAADRLVIGMVCRNHPMKDPHNLLDALAKLTNGAGPPGDVDLLIAGRGFDERNDAIRAAIAERGLDDRVRLLGPREDVVRLLTAVDLLVMPSAWGEGFPNVVGEAMATGVPCVVTDVGDAAWVVGDTGQVVSPSDPDALAAALGRLIDLRAEERIQLGEQARARIVDNFAIETIVKRYDALYGKIAEGGSLQDTAPAATSLKLT